MRTQLTAAAFLALGCARPPTSSTVSAAAPSSPTPLVEREHERETLGASDDEANDEGPEERFPVPAWFSSAILPDAVVLNQGRSIPDDQGLFAAFLLLTTGVPLTPESCISHMRERIGREALQWRRTEAGPQRVTLRGDAERYEITLVCGVMEGSLRASVNYRWTR